MAQLRGRFVSPVVVLFEYVSIRCDCAVRAEEPPAFSVDSYDRDHDLLFGEYVDLFESFDLVDLFDLVARAFFLARWLESALAVHLSGFNQITHSIENGIYFFGFFLVVCEHLPQLLRRSVPL